MNFANKHSPLLLKEGWPDHYENLNNSKYCYRPGWLICFNFKISHNIASAEGDLFLRNDLKDFIPCLLKMFLFFIAIKIKKRINQPPRPGNQPCIYQIINRPGAFAMVWLFATFAHWAKS
jgi:hypothetical protein